MDYDFKAGSAPLLISMPHVGTDLPDDIAATMTPAALERADTDWHLARLYAFAAELGASTLAARWSRYVIDVNRPPDDTSLYPGLDTTGLCPLDTFSRVPLYLPGQAPDAAQVQHRLQRYWQPYHAQLRAECDRLLAIHGRVLLWDAHSIASVVPRFFSGRLPDLNIGTADGASCAPAIARAVCDVAGAQDRFSVAVNGRFKGGFITRHYGQPQAQVHALQLEMCQCLYMKEAHEANDANEADEAAPFTYIPERAATVQPLLAACVGAALDAVRR